MAKLEKYLDVSLQDRYYRYMMTTHTAQKPLKEYLLAWRKGNRLSLREAGRKFGVSHQRYVHWESGNNLPQGAYLQKVMVELRLRIEEIDFG